ncbi:MAG: signal peptidase I [Candidatus Azobacteroides sp.]|nr:signal peptidase I [Candidatus Azobacteroides sp.]
MSREKAKLSHKKRKWLYIVLSALLVALVLRAFVFESYRMPSSQMENAVLRGDYLFVNKLAYGVRVPMTWISIPFLPDSIPSLGVKTYSTFLSLPYMRFFERKVRRNNVVLYNTPSLPAGSPVDKLPLSISRCVGLPGDSIEIQQGNLYIGGKRWAQSPDLILPYEYTQKFDSRIVSIMEKLHIPLRESRIRDNNVMRYLSRFEVYSIREELPDSVEINPQERENLNYKLFIPQRGATIKLSPQNLHTYRQIIMEEQGDKAKFEDGKLYLEGNLVDSYTFNRDYYWMLSDNVDASADSRHFGFIPETHIVGKADLIWLSKESPQNPFKGYRKNRFFTKVN